jgi:ATP-binding cassette subfamily C protein CydCD
VIRRLIALLDTRVRAWGAAASTLLVLERLLLAAAAYLAVAASVPAALPVAAALAGLFALRGAVRGVARARVHERLQEAASDALLEGDVLRASPLEDEDSHAAVLDGTIQGARLLTDTVPDLAADTVAAAVLGAYVAVTEPAKVTGVALLALALAAIGVVVARRVSGAAAERAWSAYTKVNDDLLAVLGGRLELVANGHKEAFREAARERLARWREVSLQSERLSAIAGRAPVLAGALGVIMALAITGEIHGSLAERGAADAALLAAAVPPFLGVARGIQEIVRARVYVRPFLAILDGPRAPRGGAAPVPTLPARIAWEKVTFAYPGGRTVLDATEIAWEPGRVLVLAGPNGSGKSTTLRLLLGLARPQSGKVTIGGEELFDLDLEVWRRRVAYLPQRPFLADRATVREAIALLAPRASDDAMRACLERVGLWSAIGTLDVRVGTLSAGQRQRVALARLLAMDAPIVLLDEPDANLDAAGVRMVSDIVRELAATKMVALVAHTDDVLALADTLVTLRAAA